MRLENDDSYSIAEYFLLLKRSEQPVFYERASLAVVGKYFLDPKQDENEAWNDLQSLFDVPRESAIVTIL
jgi:hypothetical protein